MLFALKTIVEVPALKLVQPVEETVHPLPPVIVKVDEPSNRALEEDPVDVNVLHETANPAVLNPPAVKVRAPMVVTADAIAQVPVPLIVTGAPEKLIPFTLMVPPALPVKMNRRDPPTVVVDLKVKFP